MSKLFGFIGDDDFCLGGSIYPNPKDSSLFLPLGHHLDVYFPPCKRTRVSAPFVFTDVEQKQPSIEVLPDECLFEIFRRLPGGQERSACASVSKRWLDLLSGICREELNISSNVASKTKEEKVEDEGYLTRSLEGRKATDIRLAAIAVGTSSRGGLGKLIIRGSNPGSRVTDQGLGAIARGCPSLKVLSLWNLPSIGDAGLSMVAKGCPLLEKLDLCNCPAITDEGLSAIARYCPNMSDLTLESCSSIRNEGLEAIARSCPKLKSVSINSCPLVGDQGIACLLSQATYTLSKLKLKMLSITDLSLAVIGCYGKVVTDLVLAGLSHVTERGFWVMGNGQGLQKLNTLSVSSCPGVTDTGVEAIGKGCPNLKQFALLKCPFLSDNGLVSFAKACGSLESLQLEECHRITQFGFFGSLLTCGAKLKAIGVVNCLGIRDLNSILPCLSPCSSLRSLSIRNCPGFGDFGLAILGKLCPKLQFVNLCGLTGVTDAGVIPLLSNVDSGLSKVNLSGCVNLTDSVISVMTAKHGWTLEALNLNGCCKITDASLGSVANNCYMLSDLGVSKCQITDLGIKTLASSKQLNLQILSVSGCSLITDKSFTSLGKLGRTLLGLDLKQCGSINNSTVSLLIEQLWRCDILY